MYVNFNNYCILGLHFEIKCKAYAKCETFHEMN